MCNFFSRSIRTLGPGLLYLILLSTVTLAMAAGLEDPTRPPGSKSATTAKAVSKPRWILSSTLISPERRSAIINGKKVTLGDKVNGARVVAIEPAQVKLRNQSGEFRIRLVKYSAVKKSWAQPQASATEK